MLRALLAVAMLFGSACGYYTYVSTVQRDASGGTIAVANDQGSRDEARRRMEAHCGGGYTIVDERRVLVGQRTTTNADGGTAVTRDVHELQLSYECTPR